MTKLELRTVSRLAEFLRALTGQPLGAVPADPEKALGELGGKVERCSHIRDNGIYIERLPESKYAFIVNISDALSPEQERFYMAKALGTVVLVLLNGNGELDVGPLSNGINKLPTNQNFMCYTFAHLFLMPCLWVEASYVEHSVNGVPVISKVAKDFGVPVELATDRIRQLKENKL